MTPPAWTDVLIDLDAAISAETADGLEALLAFRHVYRHVYGRFDYGKAEPNVAVAEQTIPRLRAEITAFAAGLGLMPPLDPPPSPSA